MYGSERPLREAKRAFAVRDCPRAIERAGAASAILDARPEPHLVVGYCELRLGRPRPALRAMAAAVRRDPRNWEMHYGLALARAAAGLDPRGRLRIVRRLNPLEPFPSTAVTLLDSHDPQVWRRRAAQAPVPE